VTWKQTKTPTQRGYGAGWQRLRKVVIQRDRGLCQLCKAQGIVRAGTDVDHIQAKADGGTDALTNLRLLCASCHRRVTARGNDDIGPEPGCDARGFPTGAAHHWGAASRR
jgi:5-methylcytosine-specific restriction protein A